MMGTAQLTELAARLGPRMLNAKGFGSRAERCARGGDLLGSLPPAVLRRAQAARSYARVMAVRLHRLTFRLGAELTELAPAHLQALCDLGMPEDADLDF